MRWALGSSLRFGRLVIAVAIGLMVFGITQVRSAPVDVYPEFTPPAVQIQTEALGLSASEVEQLITVPLEQVCVPITSSTSCDQAIFVDQATDLSLSSDAVQAEIDRLE
jgi:Cu/Ag efflux pump CusA